MFWSSNVEKSELFPWTPLNVQYRMHPNIRKIVSDLTYEGALIDARAVFDRPLPYYFDFLVTKFQNHRVAVLDHSIPENKVG